MFRIALFVCPQTLCSSLGLAMDSFHLANRLAGERHFEVLRVSAEGEPVDLSFGRVAVEGGLDLAAGCDLLLIPATGADIDATFAANQHCLPGCVTPCQRATWQPVQQRFPAGRIRRAGWSSRYHALGAGDGFPGALSTGASGHRRPVYRGQRSVLFRRRPGRAGPVSVPDRVPCRRRPGAARGGDPGVRARARPPTTLHAAAARSLAGRLTAGAAAGLAGGQLRATLRPLRPGAARALLHAHAVATLSRAGGDVAERLRAAPAYRFGTGSAGRSGALAGTHRQ